MEPFGSRQNSNWPPFQQPTVPPDNVATQSGVPAWSTGNQLPLVWAAGPSVTDGKKPILRQALWQTPIFDHRPDLRALLGVRPNVVQPIWRQGYGSGGQVFVDVAGLQSTPSALTGLRVYSIEYAHPTDPGELQQITKASDLTTDYFTPGCPMTVVPFFPPGSGFPIRFWQVRLVFQFNVAHVDPVFLMTAAYY